MSDNHPDWLFDESKQIGVDYADADIVAKYDDQHERFRDFEQEAWRIATALELSKQSTVLDIGCGTGGLTFHFARICRHVYAVDVSAAMVAAVKAKSSKLGLENVTAVRSGFLTYDHNGKTPDAIIANITLHHLPDFWKQIALCRLHDLLGAKGRLFLADVVFDFDPRTYREAVDSWLSGMKELAGRQMADEAVVHLRDEFSTWEWIMTGMLERAGFRIDSNLETMANVRAYICSKHRN